MNRRCALVLAVLVFGPIHVLAQKPAPEPARAPLSLTSPVQDKNFFLLSLFETSRSAAAIVGSDSELKELLRVKREALHDAATHCDADVQCFTAGLRFSDGEVSAVSGALLRLYRAHPPVRAMVDDDLRRSGAYVRYQTNSGGTLLVAAWEDAAHGINRIIDVYGNGTAPQYAEIDSPAFDVKGQAYARLVQTVADSLDEQAAAGTLFFQPSLQFALHLLLINKRDEAGRHEPLQTKENAAAIARIRSIHWERFPYSVIVVPGSGPDRMTWALSPVGTLRLEIAVRRFRDGKAPFILVSGGYAHPAQTTYCEAVEMRKSLIADFGVPPDAIIIDPHARHTTTNLRNAARLMYRYRIPFSRKALITTDRFQSAYIESEGFTKRCAKELGYQPAKILGRVSLFDLEFTPGVDSLQIDPMDPLDP